MTVTGCATLGVCYLLDKSQYSVGKRYKVVKNAMLSPIPMEPLELPELDAKGQVDMMRGLVFSKKAKLVLIEGAQGSGKTTLVKKLLNERMAEDKVPCYYWSLKEAVETKDISTTFLQLFGIAGAIAQGVLANEVVNSASLKQTLRELRNTNGVPSVFVLDDAQRLFLEPGGGKIALFLQECYCDGLMTVIFIGSQGSCLPDFQKLSGYESRLDYMSLPPIPDEEIKAYLMGPLNKRLKDTESCQLMTDEMADWYVAHFGGNFSDMKKFVDKVLQNKEMSREGFLEQGIGGYMPEFKILCRNPKVKIILDDLVKKGSFGLTNPYEPEELDQLTQSNVIARRAYDFTWHKRLVRIAYENFVRDQKTAEEEQKRIEEEKQKKVEEEKQKKIEEEKQRKRWYQLF